MRIKIPFTERSVDINVSGGLPGCAGKWTELTSGLAGLYGNISEEQALRLGAVFACIQLYGRTFESLPLGLYEKRGNGRIRAETHPIDTLLHYEPNPKMTAAVFQNCMEINLKGWGNAYARIEFDKNWQVKHLWPLLASQVWPYKDTKTNQIFYRAITETGDYRVLNSWEVFHLPGFCIDGYTGKSPVRMHAETMGLGMAVQRYGQSFFANGARPSGILKHPDSLSEDAAERLRKKFQENYGGTNNTGKMMVLEEGLAYEQISIPPEEAQFIESRKLSVTEIARIYATPPHMIGDLERATYSNIESQDINFTKHSILPDCVLWEQEIAKKLLTGDDRMKYIAKFNLDGLLRGDTKTRYECYAIGKQNGFLSDNDIRGKEDMNPTDSGDKYYVPLNMIESNLADEYWKSRITQNNAKGGDINAK